MVASLEKQAANLAKAIATSHRDMRQVRKRVRRKLWWFRHAGAWAAVSAGLIGIDLAGNPGIGWAWFPVLAWGILVGIHGTQAFSARGSRLEQRLMRREMRRS